MKYTLIALLVVWGAIDSPAQDSLAHKHVLYADAGNSMARFYPGASITYNYNIVKWVGIGVGIQAYDFHATISNFEYVPAAFADLRVNICPRKKNQFFAFLDLGINFYKHNSSYYWRDGNTFYNVRSDNGNYGGLGVGYFRPITKRGWGPYGSLKIISNSYKAYPYSAVTDRQQAAGFGDATLVVAVGFKF